MTFKESLWHTLVDHATVYADERIVFRFKGRHGGHNDAMKRDKKEGPGQLKIS